MGELPGFASVLSVLSEVLVLFRWIF